MQTAAWSSLQKVGVFASGAFVMAAQAGIQS
jgi:hypothetical protein